MSMKQSKKKVKKRKHMLIINTLAVVKPLSDIKQVYETTITAARGGWVDVM